MDHGGEAARPTTVVSTELGMSGAVRGSEANTGSGAFDGQLGAPAGIFSRDFGLSGARHSSTGFARQLRAVAGRGEAPLAAAFLGLHRQPGPGAAYANISELLRQLGLVDVPPLVPRLPDGIVQVLNSYGYSALQPRSGAGHGVVLVDLLPGGGAVYSGGYALQPRSSARHGEVLVDLFTGDGAGHGEAFVGELMDGGVEAYDDYGYYALQHRPGAGHGEVLVDLLLPDGAGHGEVFVDLLPGGGGGAVHDDYCYDALQPRRGAGRGEVFIGPLPDGAGAVFDNSGNFAQQTVPGTGRADGMAAALRGHNLGAGNGGSGALADDLGAAYDNPGMVAEHLRRLLPFAGIGACSVAVNGLAAGPGSPAVAFDLFATFLGGLFLLILHVLRV